jgi:hypothetical protein
MLQKSYTFTRHWQSLSRIGQHAPAMQRSPLATPMPMGTTPNLHSRSSGLTRSRARREAGNRGLPRSEDLIVQAAPLWPLAPLFSDSGRWEAAVICLPTRNSTPVGVMPVSAFAVPRCRAFWQRQAGRICAEEALVTQRRDLRALARSRYHANRVPRLFDALRRFCRTHGPKLGRC